MPVDRAREVGVSALEQPDVDELLNELGGLAADDVPADELPGGRVPDELDEPGAVTGDPEPAPTAL